MHTAPSKCGRPYDAGKMFPVVQAAFPDCAVKNKLSIPKLARKLDLSNQGVYRWFLEDRISMRGLEILIEASGGRLTKESMIPFLPIL